MLSKVDVKARMKGLENRDNFILFGYNKRDNGHYALVTLNVSYANGNFFFARSESFFKEEKMSWEEFKNYLENFPVYDNMGEAYEAMKEEALKYLD